MTSTTTPAAGHNQPDLTTELKEKYAELIAEVTTTKTEAEALPDKVATKEDSTKFGAVILKVNKLLKRIEGIHESEKAEFLKKGRDVDTVFNKELRDVLAPLVKSIRQANDQFLLDEANKERARLAEEAKRLKEEADKKATEAAAAEEAGKTRVADVAMDAAVATEREATRHELRASQPALELSRTSVGGGGTMSVSSVRDLHSFDRDALDLEALRPYLDDDAISKALRTMLKATKREVKGATYYDKAKGNYRG